MVEMVLDYLANDNKGLIDYKIIGGSKDFTTIILKYGDLSQPWIQDTHSKSPVHDKQSWYRSPSQCQRDNTRAFSWHNRQQWGNDSGFLTPGNQGQIGLSTNGLAAHVYDNTSGKQDTDQDVFGRSQPVNLNFGTNVSGNNQELVMKGNSHREKCIGTDLIECVDAEVQYEVPDCTLEKGIQCGHGIKKLVEAEVQTKNQEVSVPVRNRGVQYKFTVPQRSKFSQTNKLKTENTGVTCAADMKDDWVQTQEKSREHISRHTQVFVEMSHTETQTCDQQLMLGLDNESDADGTGSDADGDWWDIGESVVSNFSNIATDSSKQDSEVLQDRMNWDNMSDSEVDYTCDSDPG
jgi:hypothetical protein